MAAVLTPPMRREALCFLLHLTQELKICALTKYTALSFFGDRFLLYVQSHGHSHQNGRRNRLIEPVIKSNLQLFALISLWIASKIHETRPISLHCLKSFADELITDHHFTGGDFIEAELVFMKVIKFDLRTGNILFLLVEDLLLQFRNTAKAGKTLKFDVCLDILDITYESEDLNVTFMPADVLAAAIMAVAYVLTVPKGRSEFPLFPWLKMVSNCEEEDVRGLAERVLMHILQCQTLTTESK